MLQLSFTWSDRPRPLISSNMLTTTLSHRLQALYLNQPHGLISYGTHTLIIILKLRPNPDEVLLVQKLLLHHPSLSLTTGKCFWEMQKIRFNSSGTYPKLLLRLKNLRNVLVYSIYDDTVVIDSFDQQSAAELKTIMPCNHQKADRRIFLASVWRSKVWQFKSIHPSYG